MQTDRFTEDLGSNICSLFKKGKGDSEANKSEENKLIKPERKSEGESERKPPRVPQNMRATRLDKGKGEAKDGDVKNESGKDGRGKGESLFGVGVGRFPRESVYDNVEEERECIVKDKDNMKDPVKDKMKEEEDEGIDNYYSDDSGTPPKVSQNKDN